MSIYQIDEILKKISFRDWRFKTTLDHGKIFLHVEFEALCVKKNEIELQKGRKWYISEHMTESEIVQTAFAAVKMAMEHEIRENFQYHGHLIFGPHFNVKKLAELCATGVHEETRSEPEIKFSLWPETKGVEL